MLLVPDAGGARERVDEIARLIRGGRGHVHLVGIGGFGMAGLAVHLRARGLDVSGCELVPGRISDWVTAHGIRVAAGHDAAHLGAGVDWVVRSTAVRDDLPEVRAALERSIPVYHRGFVLPALLRDRLSIAVSGTHGKTTTSAMIAHVLHAAGREPGFCIGGEVTALGGVAAPGRGDVLVVEADESDGTVMLYDPDVAVITNIEFDHMEHFETEEMLYRCFEVFARNARRRLIYCADDPRAREIGRRIPGAVSYGFGGDADVRGSDITVGAERSEFAVRAKGQPVSRFSLPVGGMHHVMNALGACAAALDVGLSIEDVRSGLSKFRHARRRFEKMAERNGVLVISDYAHHPTEIHALVATAAMMPHGRLRAVFQPHRYSRTRALGGDFPGAFRGVDELLLVPVYAASETPIKGGTSADLMKRFEDSGFDGVRLLASLKEAWEYLRATLAPGDVLLIVGAGDVEQMGSWARDYLDGCR